MTAGIDATPVLVATAVAPAVPARLAVGAGTRAAAIMVVLAMFAALGSLVTHAGRFRDHPGAEATPPFSLTSPIVRSLRSVALAHVANCPEVMPTALIFVSATCPHCRAELARWSQLMSDNTPGLSCVRVVVAAAPARHSESTDWLPAQLASHILWDRDGAVASALRARFVPTTAFVTERGVVVARVVGESGYASIRSNLASLHKSPPSDRGPR